MKTSLYKFKKILFLKHQLKGEYFILGYPVQIHNTNKIGTYKLPILDYKTSCINYNVMRFIFGWYNTVMLASFSLCYEIYNSIYFSKRYGGIFYYYLKPKKKVPCFIFHRPPKIILS